MGRRRRGGDRRACPICSARATTTTGFDAGAASAGRGAAPADRAGCGSRAPAASCPTSCRPCSARRSRRIEAKSAWRELVTRHGEARTRARRRSACGFRRPRRSGDGSRRGSGIGPASGRSDRTRSCACSPWPTSLERAAGVDAAEAGRRLRTDPGDRRLDRRRDRAAFARRSGCGERRRLPRQQAGGHRAHRARASTTTACSSCSNRGGVIVSGSCASSRRRASATSATDRAWRSRITGGGRSPRRFSAAAARTGRRDRGRTPPAPGSDERGSACSRPTRTARGPTGPRSS